ncbi:MAG: S8 family serine peptidase [Gemmataceae bacterium]
MPSATALPSYDDLHLDPSQYSTGDIIVAATPGTTLPGQNLGDDLYRITLSPGQSVAAAISFYDSLANVRYAQPDYVVRLAATPSDPSFSSQWGLNNTGQSGGTAGIDIGASAAWNVSTGTGRTIVAVIDTGIDLTHPDLAANIWTNPHVNPLTGHDSFNGLTDDIHGWNYVANNNNVSDDNGHGTHVAGIIGAVGNNSTGVAGVDWHVQIMPLKFLDSTGTGSLSNAILALNYAVANGATVVNNSYSGGNYFYQAFYDAIANARSHGVIFVAAAGNDGRNTDGNPIYPADYQLDNVLSVAAIDRNGNLAPFSNYGAQSVDLGAPGVSITSTYKGEGYATMSGTSMAAPFVTGAVALLRDLHPSWSYQQIVNQILATTDADPTLMGKTETGGRLDLAKAVGANNPPPPTPTPTPMPQTTTTVFSRDPILAIPDRGKVTSTLGVNSDLTIGRLSVKLSITHPKDSDLKITLTAPWGASFVLTNREGGSGHNYNTVFDDRATTPIGKGTAPFLGWFKPEQTLAASAGKNARGTWTLTVEDRAAGNTGKLTGWSITVEPTGGAASTAAASASSPIAWGITPTFRSVTPEPSARPTPPVIVPPSEAILPPHPAAELAALPPSSTLKEWLDEFTEGDELFSAFGK